MENEKLSASIFLSNESYLLPGGGGVQWCTRDYLDAIGAAGYRIGNVAYPIDQSWHAKFRRRLVPKPFENLVPLQTTDQIIRAVSNHAASVVFLNNSESLVLASELRKELGNSVKLIFCSHGAESTDLHNTRLFESESLPKHARTSRWIGQVIEAEADQRRYLDGTICISQDDLIFERWLGSKRILFLPRPVESNPIDRNPVRSRFGTVSTLNHVPNLDGIGRLAAAIDSHQETFSELRFRVVGGPPEIGNRLEQEFGCIEYVGRIDEDALRQEVSTWKCFANPVFCQGRGASTKVATALGWGIPVVSTRVGARGYRWDETLIPLADSCHELAILIKQLSIDEDDSGWTRRCGGISDLAPSAVESGSMVREFIDSIGDSQSLGCC